MIQNNNNKNNRNGESTGVSGVGGGGKAGQQNKKNHNSTKSQKSGGNNNTSNVGSGNKCTMKTTSSDVLSLASSSSSNPRSDIDEDEGVATDATNDGNTGSKTKDIKANAGKRSKLQNNRTRINKEDGLTQEMAWVRLSNGEVARTKLKTRKGDEPADSRRNENIIPNGTSHHEKQQNNKIFKRGFNVNAQEWKPSSRRTSVGNASVKDIPMLDVFLQRLDRHSYSDQTSPRGPCSTGDDQ